MLENGSRNEVHDRQSCRKGENTRKGRPRSRIAISGLVSDDHHPLIYGHMCSTHNNDTMRD